MKKMNHFGVAIIVSFLVVVEAALNGPCANGINGVCIPTSSCTDAGGTYRSGLCPNDHPDVKCCVKSSCSDGFQAGSCKFVSQCNGTTADGLCPGDNNFKCCIELNTTKPPKMINSQEQFQNLLQLDEVTKFCLKRFGFEKLLLNLHEDINRTYSAETTTTCPKLLTFQSSAPNIPVCDILLPYVAFDDKKLNEKLRNTYAHYGIEYPLPSLWHWVKISKFITAAGKKDYTKLNLDPRSFPFTYVKRKQPIGYSCNFCGQTDSFLALGIPDIATFPSTISVNGKRKTNYFSCCDQHDMCYSSGTPFRTCDVIFYYCVSDYFSWINANRDDRVFPYYQQEALSRVYTKSKKEGVVAALVTERIKVKNAPLIYMSFVVQFSVEDRTFEPISKSDLGNMIFFSGCTRLEWLSDKELPAALRLLPACNSSNLTAIPCPSTQVLNTQPNSTSYNNSSSEKTLMRPVETLVNTPTGASYLRKAYFKGTGCKGTPIRIEYVIRENSTYVDTSCYDGLGAFESYREETLTKSVPMTESPGWFIYQTFKRKAGYECPATPFTVFVSLKDCFPSVFLTKKITCTDNYWQELFYHDRECAVATNDITHSLNHENECYITPNIEENYFCG